MSAQMNRARAAPWLRFFAVLTLATPFITLVLSGATTSVFWFLFVQLNAIGFAVTQWVLADVLEPHAYMKDVMQRKLHVYFDA